MPERVLERGNSSSCRAWSLFWQADNLRACSPATSAPGAPPQDADWQRFFRGLPVDSTILDVGTGNGALALLARRELGAAARIHGVDAADIDPVRFVSSSESLRSIAFHGRVAMESLPFPDAHFDAVVGQYALEYSDTRRSVGEIMRVLAPGGRFCFLLHAAGGMIERRNAMQQGQARALLTSPLFPDLRRLLEAIYRAQELEGAATPPANAALDAARAEIARFGAMLARLEARFADDTDRSLVDRLLLAVRRIPAARLENTLPELLQQAADVETLLEAQLQRLRDMADAVLDDASLKHLERGLLRVGAVDLVLDQARTPAGGLMGYWISGARRPPV